MTEGVPCGIEEATPTQTTGFQRALQRLHKKLNEHVELYKNTPRPQTISRQVQRRQALKLRKMTVAAVKRETIKNRRRGKKNRD
jgi:hypothetical protein